MFIACRHNNKRLESEGALFPAYLVNTVHWQSLSKVTPRGQSQAHKVGVFNSWMELYGFIDDSHVAMGGKHYCCAVVVETAIERWIIMDTWVIINLFSSTLRGNIKHQGANPQWSKKQPHKATCSHTMRFVLPILDCLKQQAVSSLSEATLWWELMMYLCNINNNWSSQWPAFPHRTSLRTCRLSAQI